MRKLTIVHVEYSKSTCVQGAYIVDITSWCLFIVVICGKNAYLVFGQFLG